MSSATLTINDEVDEIMPGIIADRRFLHQHPELGFQEHETAAFVADRLRQIGVDDVRTGVGRTGVTGLIRGTASGPGRCVLLRADMDALPITELNDVEYKSLNDGVMHACGHDAHVAMMLAAARLINARRDGFSGAVKLLFQPAEEGLGGAMAMIEDGALTDPVPDATIGLHIWQHSDLGYVEVRDGVAMVAADALEIKVKGKGGHGARPQTSIDPIVIAAAIVNGLQTLVSRETDPTMPAVITIGSMHAGLAANVIPDSATLRGSLRTVSAKQRDELVERINMLVTGIAESMRGSATVTVSGGVPPTINDPAIADIVRGSCGRGRRI